MEWVLFFFGWLSGLFVGIGMGIWFANDMRKTVRDILEKK